MLPTTSTDSTSTREIQERLLREPSVSDGLRLANEHPVVEGLVGKGPRGKRNPRGKMEEGQTSGQRARGKEGFTSATG